MIPKRYDVRPHLGRPAIHADGEPVALPSYCSCGPGFGEEWKAAHRNFAKHGCSVFWLSVNGGWEKHWGTTPFWTGPGQFHNPPAIMPPSHFGLVAQALTILSYAPDARFFVRMSDMPPARWFDAHPGDAQVNSEGRTYDAASLASDAYIGELCEFLRTIISFCESSVWADRVIGYVLYPHGEGGTMLANEGFLFDRAPVMKRRFTDFVRHKYVNDESVLRRAWHDPSATFSAIEVPSDQDFRTRAGHPVPYWPSASDVAPERDYFEFQRDLFGNYLRATISAIKTAAPNRLCGIDALKANMLGWMLHPIFSGKSWRSHYGDFALASGSAGIAEWLDLLELDLVATPHDYRCRWPGMGYDPEGVGDSIVLHGKLMLIEEDQRSYANNERDLFGAVQPGQEAAIFHRNLAAAVSRGQHTYPMDVCVGYFESDAIQDVLEQRRKVETHCLSIEHRDVPAVVMLVDDRAGLYTDFSAEYNDLAVIRQRIGGLNHCGVPTRTYLLEDLARDDFPACHKLFVLPNLFKYDTTILELLQRKLFNDGNVIVFGPGSGITDGQTCSPEFARHYTRIEFDLMAYEYPRFVTIDAAHPVLTRDFDGFETYGDSHRYGPVLVPKDSQDGVVRLGSIPLDNGRRRAGLVLKEFGKGAAGNGTAGTRGAGDYAVVFSAAVPLPPKLLRNLARFSGTHVYGERNDVIFADAATLAIHGTMNGRRVLHLPKRCDVFDMITDTPIATSVTELSVEINGDTTRWFRLA